MINELGFLSSNRFLSAKYRDTESQSSINSEYISKRAFLEVTFIPLVEPLKVIVE